MNNIFQKNLIALAQKNPELATKLQTYIPAEVPQLTQENGAYNILYKEKFIHNPKNPLGEAIEIFTSSENQPVSIHLIYGLGLGYLFQLVASKSLGTVILYEPDLNILWFAFTLVDFSNDILKNNIYIASTFNNVSEIIYKKSGMKNLPVLLSLPSQRAFDKKGFDELVDKLKNLVGAFSLDLKYTQKNFYPTLVTLIKNIPSLLKEQPLADFKDIYKGKTAVVVSAGPTLDKNIETLKKNRDKYILFTVGTAVKTLYANNLKPDFLCIIETYNSSRQVEGLDLSDVNFITEPYANPELRKFKFKNIFSHISANNPINHFWAEICEKDIDEYWSRGTVSYTALNCARLLGCSKIILVGQDLAYIEGQCYSKDSAYKDLECRFNKENNRWEIVAKDFEKFANAISPLADATKRERVAQRRLRNLNASLHYVKGIRGDMIPTESVYATFVRPLEEYARNFNSCEFINTSMVGAQIDGYKNIPLEEALKDSLPVENLDLVTNLKFNREKVFLNLKLKIAQLKEALVIIKEGQRLSKNINNDIKRFKSVNAEILKNLKKNSLNYITLTGEFAEKSKMLDFIVKSDKINLDYEMKMLKEFTVENITNINKLLGLFYENTEKRILEVERFVNESINTAS